MKKSFVFVGILLGLVLIFIGIFNPDKKQKLSDDIVALVDNHPILKSDLDLALKALSMNKDNQITSEQIQLVKDRLIDEQLLLQRGIDLDLHQTSNPIRKLIVNSMIDNILSENNDFLIDDKNLKKFYNDNISFFLPSKELRLKLIFLKFRSQEEDEKRLDTIRERLINGDDFDIVSKEEGDTYLPEIPDTFLPERKLKDYIDPNLVKNAFNIISDIPTKLITFSDDMDGFRKVPDNIPNQDMLKIHIDKPLSKVPDPFEKYNSFAEHNNEKLKSFLKASVI